MLMVVTLHYYDHGGLIYGGLKTDSANWFVGNGLVAVNCFALLSGYFQCTSQFKLKRVVAVWVQAAFYSVVLYIAAAVYLGRFSITSLIKSGFVIITEQYWFVTAYLLMYIVTPFLNAMISAMDKRLHWICCCTLLGIFCIAHYVTTWLLGTPMLTSFFYSYNSILVVPASIGLFLAMRTVNIEGKAAKVVGFLAPLAFGVYLIHDHPSIRPILWSILKPYAFASSPWMIPYALVCVVGVFLACCLVEWLRQKVFQLLGISRLCDRFADKLQNKWK